MKQENKYSITMLEFTKILDFPNAWLFAGQYVYEGTSPITYTIGLIQGGDSPILVDTGYDMNKPESEAFAKAQHHIDYQSPANVLKKVGVDPADVKHIIITHAHWDHMGAIKLFPNATFYIQKEELLSWIELKAMPKQYDNVKGAALCVDIEECVSLLKDGRLVLLDGDKTDLFPGIDIRVARYGHSFASNVVVVNTKDGKFAFAGDVVYVKAGIVGGDNDGVALPNGFAVGGALDTIRTVQDILGYVDGNADHILLTHEVSIWEQFETVETADRLHIGYVVR